MKIEQTQAFCPVCNRPSLFARPGVNHLIHAIVSLVFLGLWIPVWLVVCLWPKKPFRCQTCGTALGQSSRAEHSDPVRVQPQGVAQGSEKSLRVYRLLGLFFGLLGVHNLYAEKWWFGLIQALATGAAIYAAKESGDLMILFRVWSIMLLWVLAEVAGTRRDGNRRLMTA